MLHFVVKLPDTNDRKLLKPGDARCSACVMIEVVSCVGRLSRVHSYRLIRSRKRVDDPTITSLLPTRAHANATRGDFGIPSAWFSGNPQPVFPARADEEG
jgi:hypothetical protein